MTLLVHYRYTYLYTFKVICTITKISVRFYTFTITWGINVLKFTHPNLYTYTDILNHVLAQLWCILKSRCLFKDSLDVGLSL
jgi:hypothetical protein